MNSDTLSAWFINHLFRSGRSRTLHVQIKRSFLLFEEFPTMHNAQMSTPWRLEWHSIRSAVSLQVYGLFNQRAVCTSCNPLINDAWRSKWYWCLSNTNDRTVQRTERCFGSTSAIAVQLIVLKKSHAPRNSTLLLKYVDWSIVSRPQHSANYSIIAIVPNRLFIACKAANESILIDPMNT